jgi:hypothetical protein
MRELIGREIGLVAGGDLVVGFDPESRQETVKVVGRRSGGGSGGRWPGTGDLADAASILQMIERLVLGGGGSREGDSDSDEEEDESEDTPPPVDNDTCVITNDPYAPGGGQSLTLRGDCEDYPPGTFDDYLNNLNKRP